ncbi:hypothetical protein EJ06DRAFT_500898, partial [Trichodelitschia bisporula]
MEPKDHHKRSKSQIAKSLLSKVGSSKQDVREGSDGDEPQLQTGGNVVITSPSDSNVSLPSQPRSHHGSSRSRHRPHLSTTMSRVEGDSTAQHSPPSQAQPELPQPSSPTATTLEQSVKLFRLFEALRNGDTAAIAKAIREQSPAALSNQSVASTSSAGRVEGTTILHLAIQCAELPVIEYVLSTIVASADPPAGLNARDRDGNTPLHVAAKLGRAPVVRLLLDQDGVNDSLTNYAGQTPLDQAYTPEISQALQLARSLFIDDNVKRIHELVAAGDHTGLERVLKDPRVQTTVDVNGGELATEAVTVETGGTLLHEAARRRDMKLIQVLLLNGADPFRRDRKGKLPQDVTKDDRTRAILKKSPAAAEARQGIQEKTILGASPAKVAPGVADPLLSNKEGREMKGYLKKWTNYTGGWKLRWFVLEDGVLSYYKHQDDSGSACRGAINMRIAKLNMDPQDKLRFEIQGKSSIKYHLKANHEVEAKRWYWALNNAIQWSKDEAREEERRQVQEQEALRNARLEVDRRPVSTRDGDNSSLQSTKNKHHLIPSTALGVPLTSNQASTVADDDDMGTSAYEPSFAGADLAKMVSQANTTTIEADLDDDEEYGDDASSHEAQPASKDAFNITAHSVRLQLDLLAQVSTSLQAERTAHPDLPLSDPGVAQALSAYDSAVGNLKNLVGDLLRISRDRDAYWQYRLDREAGIRRMWEESMARVAHEQEALETKIGESEDKRKRTKRALRDALVTLAVNESKPTTPALAPQPDEFVNADEGLASPSRRRSTFVDLSNVPDSDSDDDEEFFDAIGAGEVEVVEMPLTSPVDEKQVVPTSEGREKLLQEIRTSFKGYEDPVRTRLKMDADDRPKISLWGILKSMIGKDMTKMTLPVSFNEPTSLLQRVAEDMEYTDLLDTAASRLDSTERMVYVAAFAASEYASTIGRVAKPFNPLLGETYEYARPDKGFRFFIEQVSHHPPIGAAWAESPSWDYYGESAVKSKFYGKSFDINPLGTWFLRLRPSSGGEELYTWKKVTSSVIGIITGNPTVDNYGVMEVKNWSTGEVCTIDFKPRGWKASSAFQVVGRVLDATGKPRWTIGGHWNQKIYARLTPGYEDAALSPSSISAHGIAAAAARDKDPSSHPPAQAFLVWEAHARPTGIPFNLTPFVLTLNALPSNLKPLLAPTDTRLRPDQRAMEDGEYDLAATEKNRVEEKQRAARRRREQDGTEFVPRWFVKDRCSVTGEEYWRFEGGYWRDRDAVARGGTWEGCEDIF